MQIYGVDQENSRTNNEESCLSNLASSTAIEVDNHVMMLILDLLSTFVAIRISSPKQHDWFQCKNHSNHWKMYI